MFDFNEMLNEKAAPRPLNPTEIFYSLPKTGTKFGYLRSVQSDVLNEWHSRRGETDIIVKMNTGSGKTLVGLLMLQSVLHEQLGPALYLCPNKQLVEQVHRTAQAVNLPTIVGEERGDLPPEFLNSEAIFVTTFKKLFNGKSKFGIPGAFRQVVDLGGVLVDDAHSCLTLARENVTLTFEAGTEEYKKLRDLFGSVLSDQSPGRFAEIQQSCPYGMMVVRYWAWIEQQHTVAKILAGVKNNDSLLFGWDLIKEDLATCHCFISGTRIEITTQIVPIESVPSFAQAKRRFFLSASVNVVWSARRQRVRECQAARRGQFRTRNVMRPRVRSYGEISTFTRSPGMIRIKCFRIFPPMWANTSPPMSSSTMKVVFGRAVFTRPSTSIASSLIFCMSFSIRRGAKSARGAWSSAEDDEKGFYSCAD